MLNTSSDEFSPAYYRDGIAFIGQFIKKKSLYKWNNKPWLRLFYLPYQPKGYENGQVEAFSLSNQVKKNHQGPVAFSRNNQMMYFSQNIKSKRNKISSIGIFTAKKNDGKWKEIQAFELNNPEYSIAHPTLSADGATVFFVSDMPGGYGGTDIYFSKFMNGQWSKPYNIGNVINTPFNEMFPFLHQDGTLYFASEGHAGYGGLDIFYSKYENGKWTKPVNLGKDINSSYDDFGLILDKNKYSGYLSSNRLGGKGGDDIYRIEVENYHQLMKDLQPKDTVSTHNNTENEIYLNSEIVDSEKNIEPALTVSNHEVATNSLVYKIQLGVFSKVDEKWLEHLKQYGDTEIVQVQGQKTFKVYLLPFYTYRSVSDTLKIIKSKEVKDAFIVAFYDSEVISIEQAKQLEKSK